MASSVYSEVTSVSTYGFERDRVLDKLKTAVTNLPYTVDDITISHNDFAVSDVYNNSIKKLYKNYLYLIANAELLTKTPPTSSAPSFLSILSTFEGELSAVATDPSGNHGQVAPTASLSGLQETYITLKNDGTEKFLYFNYSPDQSVISETDVNLTTITTLISGNEVEFNKTFKFKNVVSVDIVDNLLFVLDKDSNTAFKFDITGLITDDNALKRTGISDSSHPGRYLLKTIGGEGTSQTKNKLSKPSSLSVYKNRIYILDNGHNSLKVFDLDFNFIQEIHSPNLFNNSTTGELVSIVVDKYSDTNESVYGYILSSKGKIIEYNVDNNTLLQPQALFNFYDTRLYTLSGLNENDSFKKIVNSKAVKHILYICNNGKIYKYYKSNLNQYLGVLDLTIGNSGIKISGKENEQQILSFDTALYNNKDYVAVTTRVNSDQSSNQRVSTYVYEDEHITTKLYSESLYTNYFTLSDILVLPQEIVNNITFNKTTKKLIYNHYSLFENLNKKVYSWYNTASGSAAVPTLCTVNHHEFTKPTTLNDDTNLYIGVNEPLLTDVINRPLKLLYSQQESLFDLIKEEALNNNPPDGIAIRLPANTESFPNVLTVKSGNSSSATVSGGDSIKMTVTRTNVLSAKPSCSFKYYTTLGTATEGDIEYISSDNKSIETFTKDETTKEIFIDTMPFFIGDPKTFNFIIEDNTSCVIDPDLSTVTGTITGIGSIYTISMSATTLSINEGSTGRVAVKRYVTKDPTGLPNIQVESSVNIQIAPEASDRYTPIVTGSNNKNVVNDNEIDFSSTGIGQQTYADYIGSTSTIFFTDIITSVVFDISAINTLSDSPVRSFEVEIQNPSDDCTIDIPIQTVTIGPEFKTTNLFLSSISATYRADSHNATNQTLLSCVNIWEALSASTAETNTTAFSTFSATNPYNVNFTINNPLSVFSVSTVSAAVQFIPDHDLVYSVNQLNVIVEDTAALVGKGGHGGHGWVWDSGTDFTNTGDISASEHSGEAGGYVIGNNAMGTYFNTISVNNSGIVYGGAGGGGGGILGLSASTMANVQYLSGGCGGGGGQGIHTSNAGTYGLAAVSSVTTETESDTGITETTVYTQHSEYADIFLQNGAAGGATTPGIGGGFNTGAGGYPTVTLGVGTVPITEYPAMTGMGGGNLGNGGDSDSETVPIIGSWTPHSSFETVSAEWGIRVGGDVGRIVGNSNVSFSQVLTTGSTGTFSSLLY